MAKLMAMTMVRISTMNPVGTIIAALFGFVTSTVVPVFGVVAHIKVFSGEVVQLPLQFFEHVRLQSVPYEPSAHVTVKIISIVAYPNIPP